MKREWLTETFCIALMVGSTLGYLIALGILILIN